MSSTYQVSVKDEEDSRLKAAMKRRKDLINLPNKDAIKILAFEKIDELLEKKS